MSDEPEQPDDSGPTPERQAELRAASAANMAAGKPPYEGVRIRTRGELSWIMREHDWSGETDAGGKERANLRGADLSRVNLSGAHLMGANLANAYLTGAIFSGATVEGTNLRGATLSYARFDSVAILGQVILDDRFELNDIFWSDMPETLDPTVGNRDDRIAACRDAARFHRRAAIALRAQGLSLWAAEQRLQELRMERQALRLQRRYGGWLFSWLLDLVAGYGEKPGRILLAYGVVLLVFTCLYWRMGIHSFSHESGIRAFWDSFLVSLSAIHGRTTFEQLGAWSLTAWTAAVESVIGIVIEGVFVAMLVQRFFAR